MYLLLWTMSFSDVVVLDDALPDSIVTYDYKKPNAVGLNVFVVLLQTCAAFNLRILNQLSAEEKLLSRYAKS